jgi:hypothetical protein
MAKPITNDSIKKGKYNMDPEDHTPYSQITLKPIVLIDRYICIRIHDRSLSAHSEFKKKNMIQAKSDPFTPLITSAKQLVGLCHVRNLIADGAKTHVRCGA